jgi:hypothetical protein
VRRSPVPQTAPAAVAAAPALRARRRRPLSFSRIARASVPYLLVLPVVAAIAPIRGYPR